MPDFDIIKKIEVDKTFRVASVMGKFDLSSNKIEEKFKGSIDFTDNWQVGLIVGRSGTGKTTIAKQLFGNAYISNYQYSAASIVDDMPKNSSIEEITKTFSSVGFSSPPSWLKPYSVLSGGEKMRVDLARAILENNELFVFDEYTSVVDRNIAKIGSLAIQKAIRSTNRKFIAVGCHFDIIEWLMPDWIFNTDTMTFQSFEGQKKNKPEISIEFRKSINFTETKQVWGIFKKYHYLRHDIAQNFKSIYLYVNEEIAGIICYYVFPNPMKKKYIKIGRLVILPDFQGIGLSSILVNYLGDIVKEEGYTLIGQTSNPAIIASRAKDKKWICTRKGRCIISTKTGSGFKSKVKTLKTGENATTSQNRITTSWIYVG